MTKENKIVIAVLVVAFAVMFFLYKCNRDRQAIVTTPTDSFYWRDKYNNEVASRKGLEEQFGYKEKHLLDSIAEIHKVKPDRIKEYVTVYQEGKATIVTHDRPVITYVDSGRGKEIKNVFQMFENPYYLVEATIDLSGLDSSFALIETVDTLSVVWKEVREGRLFNKKRFLQLDVTNKNPYNHITGLDAYRVPLPKPKKFGIGVVGGYGFANGIEPRPFIGVGLNYSIIRF